MGEKQAARKIELADAKVVRRYVDDLKEVLSSSTLPEQKAFISNFVKEVKVTGSEALLTSIILYSCCQKEAFRNRQGFLMWYTLVGSAGFEPATKRL